MTKHRNRRRAPLPPPPPPKPLEEWQIRHRQYLERRLEELAERMAKQLSR